MTRFVTLSIAAMAAILIGTAVPAVAAGLELAQGKSGKVMSGEKGADKAREAMERKDERTTGRDNAMERGEGQKKGLMKQADDEKKRGKPAK